MNPGKFIYIDWLFFLPYRILRYCVGAFPVKTSVPLDLVVVIKLMGMGSITRFASLCDVQHIDKEKIVFITFKSQQEICQLLGFTNTRFIRTSNPGTFLSDCFKIMLNIWHLQPSFIVNYERCSYAVGTFCFILGSRTRAHIICFEHGSPDYVRGRVNVHSIDQIHLPEIFNTGIRHMALNSSGLKEQVIEIENKKVLVNCNASNYFLARRYPDVAYGKLIEMVQGSFTELEFYFTGSKEESAYVEKITSKLSLKGIHAVNVAGQWTLQQLSEELASSKLFITGDSGPLHIAASLGVTTLAIWGPTQSKQFGYENFTNLVNYSLHESCSPCLIHPYSQPGKVCHQKIPCLRNIPAEHLFQKVKVLLSGEYPTRCVKVFPGMVPRQVQILELQPS